jgi:hypothetical protein
MNKRKSKYLAYINSKEWKELKLDLLIKRGCRCEKCGIDKQPNLIQVHHLTYDRLYNELETDLLLVCGKCHKEIHNIKDKKKTQKKPNIKKQKQNIPSPERIEKIVIKNYNKIKDRLQSGKYTLKQAKSSWKGIVTWAKNRNYKVDINL